MLRVRQRSVSTPSGVEWRIGRRWISRGEIKAEGSDSGVPFGDRYSIVWTLQNGSVMREQIFFDWEAALQTVGLRE
jgi:hypothetical protein